MNKFALMHAVNDSALPPQARHIMLILILWADPHGHVPRSRDDVAVAMGVHRATLYRWLPSLVATGWVSQDATNRLSLRLVASQNATGESVAESQDATTDRRNLRTVPISTSSTCVEVVGSDYKGAEPVEESTELGSTTTLDNSTNRGVDRTAMTGTPTYPVTQRNQLPDEWHDNIEDFAPDHNREVWDKAWEQVLRMRTENTRPPTTSLTMFLNWCAEHNQTPMASRFVQWFGRDTISDEHEVRTAVVASRPQSYEEMIDAFARRDAAQRRAERAAWGEQ